MIIEYARKHGMLRPGDRVLCAVSGGADSMCLLHFLSTNAEALGIEVCAAHFDHHLRGEESARDRAFVEDWCRDHGIPCAVGEANVAQYAAENGLGIEEAARKLRYAFLFDAARKLRCLRVATAHNCDDNAETLLINLIRGSGARGLCGIPPVRGKLIRPLLCMTRAEIEAYNEKNGVPYVTDSSNLTDEYTRNRLRHKAMPVLKEINPSASESFLRTTELLREDELYLSSLAESFIAEKYEDDSLPAAELAELPKPVAARVLRSLCGSALTAKQTESIFSILDAEGVAHTDIHGLRVTKDRGRLYFGQSIRMPRDTVIGLGKETPIPDSGLTVTAELLPPDGEIFKSLNNFYFNYDSIYGTISFTTRRDGDKIRLAGRNCTKSLKDLYRERSLSQRERDTNPVLRDEQGIIAVYGFGVAERCRAKKGDALLHISILTNQNENSGGAKTDE